MNGEKIAIRLLEERIRPLPDAERERWVSAVTHTHTIRPHQVSFEQMKRQLLAWSRKNMIDAVGLGSPWEPVSAASYGLHEGQERDRYYAGEIDPQSVMDREDIQALFDDLNGAEGNRTLFYHDNETPKGRRGHIWYFGFRYLVPAWHDYSQDNRVQYCDSDPATDANAITGKPHARRSCLEVACEQRRAGAVAVWAHPTSWWWQGEGEDREFVTNIAAELALHLLVDGFLDGMVVMGYDACHRWYQKLWFHLLDTGAIVPGFAETDASFDGANLLEGRVPMRNFLPARRDLNVESIVEAARRGECFASTGAFLKLTVEGTPMGGVVETGPGRTHRVSVEAEPWPGESRLSRLDIVGRGGEVLFSKKDFPGGVLELEARCESSRRGGPAYLVARAFAQSDDPDAPRQQSIHHMAITNPVYLHPPGFRFEPVRTDVRITFGSESPWLGGRVEFMSPDGGLIEGRSCAGTVRADLPGNAKVVLTAPDGATKSFYPAIENERALAILRYLYDGEFLRDHPGLVPGEVPPEAFRLKELEEALRSFSREL